LFPPDELRNLVPLEDGEIFSDEKIRDGIDAIARLYRSNGYLDFRLSIRRSNDEHQSLSVVMELKQGPKYRVGDIRAVGGDPALAQP
jgi:outer membrane protein assembly factor BamA